jgi:hypothetical protein
MIPIGIVLSLVTQKAITITVARRHAPPRGERRMGEFAATSAATSRLR